MGSGGSGCGVQISVLLFGPQGEEPVVDSTLARREGAVQRGKIPFT